MTGPTALERKSSVARSPCSARVRVGRDHQSCSHEQSFQATSEGQNQQPTSISTDIRGTNTTSSSNFEPLVHPERPRNIDFHHEKGHFGGVAGIRWPDHRRWRRRRRLVVAGHRCSRPMGHTPYSSITVGTWGKGCPWDMGHGSWGG